MTQIQHNHVQNVQFQNWTDVCALEQIPVNGGVCALVGKEQVALFRLPQNQLFAISNFDPFARANVLSRGLLGNRIVGGKSRLKVASPLLKHNFDLETGECLDDPTIRIKTYQVKIVGNRVLVSWGA